MLYDPAAILVFGILQPHLVALLLHQLVWDLMFCDCRGTVASWISLVLLLHHCLRHWHWGCCWCEVSSVIHTGTRTSCWMFHVRKKHELRTCTRNVEVRRLRRDETIEDTGRDEMRRDVTPKVTRRDDTEIFENHVSRPRHSSRDDIPVTCSPNYRKPLSKRSI